MFYSCNNHIPWQNVTVPEVQVKKNNNESSWWCKSFILQDLSLSFNVSVLMQEVSLYPEMTHTNDASSKTESFPITLEHFL